MKWTLWKRIPWKKQILFPDPSPGGGEERQAFLRACMLTLTHVSKEYRTGSLIQKALDDVSLSFRSREFVAILGPSGSGKTTLLNMIGGLDRYDSGEMRVDGTPTSQYRDRDWDTYRNHTIGFVFQSYNLIPHQTLLSNVELAMTLSGVGREERKRRARNALERVGLLEQAQKKPSQLSGGQMQRVAIARALVNEPAILLADEPTGALDSDTGEQVMQLLKEMAEDHLVIMVTHNPELAEKYATRIVRLKDGKITEDTDPPATEAEKEKGKSHVRVKKPSMSFLTALSLSVANLFSKKARTALVAFAASIGIVGIALILSLSNGANAYIHQMERDSLSQYQIEITTSAFSMEETMMSLAAMRAETGGSSEGNAITERQMMGGMLASTQTNDLASLKRWFDSGYSGVEDYTRGITYSYGISPQIYRLKDEDDFRQVNPDQTFTAFGLSMDNNLSGALSTYGFNEVFAPLPENEKLYKEDYELLAGTWPRKDTDLVLVLTGTGGIPDYLLYTMGIKDADALNEEIARVVAGGSSDKSLQRSGTYQPEDFLGISFRLLPAYRHYTYDEKLGVWVDVSTDRSTMRSLLDQAETMEIVGVVRLHEDVRFGLLQMGIGYPQSLLTRLMREADESAIVKAQRSDESTDVLTGIRFGESADNSMDFFRDMLTIHPEKIADAVSFRWEDLASLETDETRMTAQRLVRIMREFSRTRRSETLSTMIRAGIPRLLELVEIDEEKIGEAISFEMNEAQMQEMFAARAAALRATASGNLSKFGYADPQSPLRVTIYPSDFDSKNEVIRLLDAYNAAMEEEGHEDRVIIYTDYVGALMSSVTTIIDVITYVLIAFVAVSLVVSSIMIGIITYISVLERRKEIGILRAMGASRRNIREVFNAETFIIGLLAGALGIGLTLLLQIPINRIIHSLADQEGIRAFLPPGAGMILVLLCIFLTIMGGWIPARKASRQDPVLALRSE